MISINKESFNKLLGKENLKVSQFANKLGISRTQVWRVLNFKCNPGTEFIARFKQAYPKEKFEEYFFIDGVA